eukprot:1143115-Pelagomonas_calceolata.AAC.4
MTEALRALGVGKQEYEQARWTHDSMVLTQQPQAPLPPGDVEGVMQRISGDFKQGYIVTGVLPSGANCCYLQRASLMTPSTTQLSRSQPSVRMLDIRRTDSQGGSQTLRSEWELRTYLNLPWRPLISILNV